MIQRFRYYVDINSDANRWHLQLTSTLSYENYIATWILRNFATILNWFVSLRSRFKFQRTVTFDRKARKRTCTRAMKSKFRRASSRIIRSERKIPRWNIDWQVRNGPFTKDWPSLAVESSRQFNFLIIVTFGRPERGRHGVSLSRCNIYARIKANGSPMIRPGALSLSLSLSLSPDSISTNIRALGALVSVVHGYPLTK